MTAGAISYLLLFLGLLVGGELILAPALFFAVAGFGGLAGVVVTAFAATFLSDAAWYALGRFLPAERVLRIPFLARRRAAFAAVGRFFEGERRPSSVIIGSKFVYGTRIVVQVLAGLHRVPLSRYLVSNAVGVVLWIAALASLAEAARHSTADTFAETVANIRTGILVFFLFVAASTVAVGALAKRSWFRR